ncbi:MAG: hypothetical protein L0216_05985 [Planctomycetales bacterium]|nr:hypothetical protein [Planctomycetales bacterium]
MRRWAFLFGAALVIPGFAESGGPALADDGAGVAARDLLAWKRAGVAEAEILARVRSAPGVSRPRVAEVEELAAEGVPPEAVLLLLRRALAEEPRAAAPAASAAMDAKASMAPMGEGPRGSLRVRSRGPALAVTVAGDVLTVVPAEGGAADVPAGGSRRFDVPALLYQARLAGTPDTLPLRIVAGGTSCVVVEAPHRLSAAEDVASGRADEDPPRGSPADTVQRRSHESYAARWFLVDGTAIEEHEGTTVSFRRRGAVARVHCEDPRFLCGSLGLVSTTTTTTVRATAVASGGGCCEPCLAPGALAGSCVCPEERCAAAADPCPVRDGAVVRVRYTDPEPCPSGSRGVVVRAGWVWRRHR